MGEYVMSTAKTKRKTTNHPAPTGRMAVIDFITGALIENPRRVGRALRNELASIHSARRGTYRIMYRIDDDKRVVTMLRINHRGQIYRTRSRWCAPRRRARSDPTRVARGNGMPR